MQKNIVQRTATCNFPPGKREKLSRIGKMLNVSKNTVVCIIRRFNTEDRIESISQIGRLRILSAREEKRIVRKVKNDPHISVLKIVNELLE